MNLVDADGNHHKLDWEAEWNDINHKTVLKILAHCAQRFLQWLNGTRPEDPLHSWTLDKTGTLETLRLLICNELDVDKSIDTHLQWRQMELSD